MNVRAATSADLEAVSILFDGYRQFYQQSSDLQACRDFLLQRFQQQDSAILVAEADDGLLGFTQLYPFFSSVRMQRIYILNDLFVSVSGRRRGVGEALMQQAEAFGRQQKAAYLVLQTGRDNHQAQKLYEKLGWIKDSHTFYYEIELS
ncbi:GNAT family N-acetyltransferase [Marinicella sp. W31]|uniref:GNAT family N-acetyltransferase n=1 Tax=Marinicella sp. W31 TaxID=3023713 RepID=UPI0037563F52